MFCPIEGIAVLVCALVFEASDPTGVVRVANCHEVDRVPVVLHEGSVQIDNDSKVRNVWILSYTISLPHFLNLEHGDPSWQILLIEARLWFWWGWI